MVNLTAVNAAAVNAGAAAGTTYSVRLPLRQQVTLRVRLPLRQQVTAYTYRLRLPLRQQVSTRYRVTLPLRQEVTDVTYAVRLPLRQQVTAVYSVRLARRQQVSTAGPVAIGTTQRPAVVAVLAGVDISARLTDVVEVDREAGQSARATLSFLPLGGSVDLAAWISAPLTIDLDNGAGPVRVFTGTVSDTRYDPLRRVTLIDATDDLQALLDAMPAPIIDYVVGGLWSAAVFDSAATGWARAQDRMSTQPADLDRDAWGAVRVTPWAAAAVAHHTFGAGAIVDESLRVEPGRWREMINRIEVTAEIRYTRRLHREGTLRWDFAGGAMIDYLLLHATLPDEDMIRSAAATNGWQVVSERWRQRAPSGVYGGVLWHFHPALEAHPWQVLGANLTAARRWSQTITETYTLTVECPASIARFGANVAQDRATYSAPDAETGWEDAELPLRTDGIGGSTDLAGALTAPNGDQYFDDLPAGVRGDAIGTVLARARTALLAAHRVHTGEITVPLLPGIDTPHTARIETATATVQGRVRQVVHRLTLGGEATTTVRVALSQSAAGAQPDDVLAAPAVPPSLPAAGSPPRLGSVGGVDTHLGGYHGAPEYIRAASFTAPEDNPDWTGYVGNRQIPWAGSVTFDERFVVDWGEIPRDPIDTTAAATYRVAVPHDTVDLAA